VWSNTLISADVYQTVAAQSFPSPDSMLFDPSQNRSIALEFKPPTENKRGILTGVGQAVAYLKSASISYLVVPSRLEGYNLSEYLKELFESTICGKLPLGVITYNDDEAREVELLVDVDPRLDLRRVSAQGNVGRYWAKHVDMPLHALWIILDIAYQLPADSDNRIEAIWRKFFDEYLFPIEHRSTLEIFPTVIKKHDGTPLHSLDRIKRALKCKVDSGDITVEEALREIESKIDPHATGDNYYKSYKKNFLPFIKHLQLWDDNGHLTEDGLHLHRVGKIHGPTGETFKNYFGRILLFNGKHLELILDIEKYTRNQNFRNINRAISHIQSEYIENGLYKGAAQFLKYERIIWGHLGLLDKVNNLQFIPSRGFNFNWEKITKLCSLD
jgi:hypothetical protein